MTLLFTRTGLLLQIPSICTSRVYMRIKTDSCLSLSVCLSVHLSICLSVSLFVHLSVHLSVYPSFCLLCLQCLLPHKSLIMSSRSCCIFVLYYYMWQLFCLALFYGKRFYIKSSLPAALK